MRALDDGDDPEAIDAAMRILADDPAFRLVEVGPMMSITMHPLLGRAIEFRMASETEGDLKAWFTRDVAVEVIRTLADSVADLDRIAAEGSAR